jgi:hypothetical protein
MSAVAMSRAVGSSPCLAKVAAAQQVFEPTSRIVSPGLNGTVSSVCCISVA